MKKSLSLPKAEELVQMEGYQDINVYKYLLVKTVEKLVIEGKLIKNIDNDLKDNNEIINSICYLYPQELLYSSASHYDVTLCNRLLTKEEDKSIRNLDYLADFAQEVQLNYDIMVKAIDILYEKLPKEPTYRFNYNASLTLDRLFGVDLLYFDKYNSNMIDKLMYIDPLYGIKKDNIYGSLDKGKFIDAIEEYAYRYGIPYEVKNDQEKSKKLIKYLYNKQ